MAGTFELNELILKNIKSLPEKGKKEVLHFIEFLKIKEDSSFLEYVNKRTKETIEAKKRGEQFITLEELKRDYG